MTKVLYTYVDPVTRNVQLLRENTESDYGSWVVLSVGGKLADSYQFEVTSNFKLSETLTANLTRVGEERYAVVTPSGAVYFKPVLLPNARYVGGYDLPLTEDVYQLHAEDPLALEALAANNSYVFLGYAGDWKN